MHHAILTRLISALTSGSGTAVVTAMACGCAGKENQPQTLDEPDIEELGDTAESYERDPQADRWMIELREYLRLLDEHDPSRPPGGDPTRRRRRESADERLIEAEYSMDVYGCPSDLEMLATRDVLASYAPDVGDSVISILFPNDEQAGSDCTLGTAAYVHYSNMIVVCKHDCAIPIEGALLRQTLIHEVAHIRHLNILSRQEQFATAAGEADDGGLFESRWRTLAECAPLSQATSEGNPGSSEAGFMDGYGTLGLPEDVATVVEFAQLPAYDPALDTEAVERLYAAYYAHGDQHRACLTAKLDLAHEYRFLDRETVGLVKEIWASPDPASPGMLAKVHAVRTLVRARNREERKTR
ncbi:hypothetical protein LBMAG42_57440 [Deltaproteobacteria bacterium]|nr:hypothetical protein LBMAG42_57440 [Deltaproteobacteria bacterium]